MNQCMCRISLPSSSILFAIMLVASGLANDWPQWGGPQRDLIWRETGIVERLPTDQLLPRVWSTEVSEGYAGPAVANGRVFVMDFVRQQGRSGTERVLCLDAGTGKILWTHQYPSLYTIGYPNGPRVTPIVDEDRVYTIGAMGDMFCIDVNSGQVRWQKNFVDDYGTVLPNWGTAASPLIDGEQLISLVGGPGALLVSFDKYTGQELWRALDDPQVGYCPPMMFSFGGQRQLIIWHPRAITSLDPVSHKLIWRIPLQIRSGLTIPTPRKVGNRLFLSTFYSGPIMIEVSADGQNASVQWRGKTESEIDTEGVHCLMSTPYMNTTHIYGVCSYGQLRCLDATNGQRLWETFAATGEARWWNAFLVAQADRFFIHNEQGELIIARLSPQGYEEISRAQLIEPTREVRRRMTIWSHPAFAMQSVFARNDKEIVRVNLKAN